MLLILKQKAYQNRAASAKGEKDRLDILAILKRGIDCKKYSQLLNQYHLEDFKKILEQTLRETRKIPELNVSEHAFANFKKEILKELKITP